MGLGLDSRGCRRVGRRPHGEGLTKPDPPSTHALVWKSNPCLFSSPSLKKPSVSDSYSGYLSLVVSLFSLWSVL